MADDDERARDGLSSLRRMIASGQRLGIIETLGAGLVSADAGIVVFEGAPGREVYNPQGTVHGGYAAAILDSACGCAVLSRLEADRGFTTLELKVSYHRALTEHSGRVRAEGRVVSIGRRAAFAEATLVDGEGRLCASATSTLMVFDRPLRAP